RAAPGEAPLAARLDLSDDLRTARAAGLPAPSTPLLPHQVPLNATGGFEAWQWPGPLGPMPALLHRGRGPALLWLPDDPRGQLLPAHQDPVLALLVGTGATVVVPALRGQHGAPGRSEHFGGEVDDLAALIDAVATLPEVDPDRIVLLGAGDGGTLAWLAADATDRLHLALALSGQPDACTAPGDAPLATDDPLACALRSPAAFRPRSPVLFVGGALDARACAVARRATDTPGGPLRAVCIPGQDQHAWRPLALELVAQQLAAAVDGGGPVELTDLMLLSRIAERSLAHLPRE
ncbi:MAG: acetylxylan esterase, partial [Alphaproteobacteria bacterium]|nr:acetylxylan esterase [Alphaproteobacteria bacterium]